MKKSLLSHLKDRVRNNEKLIIKYVKTITSQINDDSLAYNQTMLNSIHEMRIENKFLNELIDHIEDGTITYLY